MRDADLTVFCPPVSQVCFPTATAKEKPEGKEARSQRGRKPLYPVCAVSLQARGRKQGRVVDDPHHTPK